MHIAPLREIDRAGWQALAEACKRFYATPTTPAEYDECWRRLLAEDGAHGLAAFVDGRRPRALRPGRATQGFIRYDHSMR